MCIRRQRKKTRMTSINHLPIGYEFLFDGIDKRYWKKYVWLPLINEVKVVYRNPIVDWSDLVVFCTERNWVSRREILLKRLRTYYREGRLVLIRIWVKLIVERAEQHLTRLQKRLLMRRINRIIGK